MLLCFKKVNSFSFILQDTCSAFDDDYNTLDLDENEMKFPTPDETPLKRETCVIIPMIRKKPNKSTLEIKPLSEMSPIKDNENELTCPVWVIKPLSEISPTKQKETDLTCTFCNKVLRSRNNLKEHIRIKHDGESRRESLLIKSLSETNPSQDDQEDEIDLTCPTCDQVLTSKHFLEEHIRTRHKGEPKSEIVEDVNDLTCPACDKVFKSRNNVKEHIRVQHNGEVKKIMKVMWECKICGESFIKNLKRYNHLKSVHDATKNKVYRSTRYVFILCLWLKIESKILFPKSRLGVHPSVSLCVCPKTSSNSCR